MIDEATAEVLVNARLSSREPKCGILKSETLATSFGWVFFYDTQAYLQTGDSDERLTGNAPLIVDASDGSIFSTGTAFPIEDYIEEYAKNPGHVPVLQSSSLGMG